MASQSPYAVCLDNPFSAQSQYPPTTHSYINVHL